MIEGRMHVMQKATNSHQRHDYMHNTGDIGQTMIVETDLHPSFGPRKRSMLRTQAVRHLSKREQLAKLIKAQLAFLSTGLPH